MGTGQKAWLVIAAGDDREHRGHDGYADLPESHYLWDENVPHAQEVQVGDQIVLWDKRTLLGASIIERIETGTAPKPINRCPDCESTGLKLRSTMIPPYRCPDCRGVFDNPNTAFQVVMTYRSHHGPGWVDLRGRLTATHLRALCVKPKSQHSMRLLRWDDFRRALDTDYLGENLGPLDHTADRIAGGHRERTVRVRIGQAEFRRRLLSESHNGCAFTGPAPAATLEAGHLYSYATIGAHHEHGGLLMRRDVHALFDRGYLAVDPSSWTIDVSPMVRTYDAYARLHGQRLTVPRLSRGQMEWLELHWAQYRA